MFLRCAIIALATATALASTTKPPSQETSRSSSTAGSYFGLLRYAFDVYRECANTDLATCLKLKFVAAVDRADRSFPEVPLLDGVQFVKKPDAIPNEPPKSEEELAAVLPRSLDAKSEALNSLIADRISNFFSSHTLQVKLPGSSIYVEEGRKKKKDEGLSQMLLVPMLLGGTLIPLALKGLVILAGNALFVSLIALTIGGVIGLKSLVGHQTRATTTPIHDNHHKVFNDAAQNGLNYARALDQEEAAQELAYNAYAPRTR